MGRKANPKCVYCAKNYRTEDEAKEKNAECYVGHNCRIKRDRLTGLKQSTSLKWTIILTKNTFHVGEITDQRNHSLGHASMF
jgi:hypothetical protein